MNRLHTHTQTHTHLTLYPLKTIKQTDIFSIMGVYPGFKYPPEEGTPVAGLEGTGVVAEVGQGVTKFTVGQRVVGLPFPSVEQGVGTWQQYLVAGEDNLAAVPDAVSDAAAASFFVNPVTVVGMLREINAPAGEWIVQTGAGSTLGRQLIQVAKHQGVKTINVVRRQALVDELKALGANEVIVSTEEDVTERIKEITGGKGAWGALDCVGGELFQKVASGVRNDGLAIIYGAMDGLGASFAVPDPLFRGIVIKGFWLIKWMKSLSGEERASVVDEVMGLLASGVMGIHEGKRFSLDQVVEAVQESQQPARGGKVYIEG